MPTSPRNNKFLLVCLGCFVFVLFLGPGPNAYLSLCAVSRKQSAISHSTVGSEMIAGDLGRRTEALKIATLFDQVSEKINALSIS